MAGSKDSMVRIIFCGCRCGGVFCWECLQFERLLDDMARPADTGQFLEKVPHVCNRKAH